MGNVDNLMHSSAIIHNYPKVSRRITEEIIHIILKNNGITYDKPYIYELKSVYKFIIGRKPRVLKRHRRPGKDSFAV